MKKRIAIAYLNGKSYRNLYSEIYSRGLAVRRQIPQFKLNFNYTGRHAHSKSMLP
jgi:hypothetical protein